MIFVSRAAARERSTSDSLKRYDHSGNSRTNGKEERGAAHLARKANAPTKRDGERQKAGFFDVISHHSAGSRLRENCEASRLVTLLRCASDHCRYIKDRHESLQTGDPVSILADRRQW